MAPVSVSTMWNRTSRRTNLTVLGLSLATIFVPIALAQTGDTRDRAAGIASFEKGDAVAASKFLRTATKKNKNDVIAWYWLGRSFEQQGNMSDARKSYEKAAKLGDSLLMIEFEAAYESWSLTLTNLKPQLTAAALSANAYVRLNPKLSRSKAQEWSERTEFLKDFSEFSEPNNLSIYKAKDVTTRARVLSKPEPGYTESAREHRIVGTVVLRALLAEDGHVRAIFPLRRLPNGLTSAAVRAARRIKFTPAIKDGKPVSMWVQLEYNFNIY